MKGSAFYLLLSALLVSTAISVVIKTVNKQLTDFDELFV
jgi:hypothetical protein